MPDSKSILERLKEALSIKKDAELAKYLGIKPNTISTWKSRNTLDYDLILSKCEDINLHWLLTGEGEMFTGKPNIKSKDPNILSCKEVDFFLVPKVKARLTAGTGTLETSSEVIGRFAFRLDWLHSITTSPKSLVLMEVYGDSMEPEIKNGDTVMVDQSQKEIIIGKIYAVGFGEEIVIKQVYKEPDKLILKSINKEYRPIELPADEWKDSVKIIGRVVWWCREG